MLLNSCFSTKFSKVLINCSKTQNSNFYDSWIISSTQNTFLISVSFYIFTCTILTYKSPSQGYVYNSYQMALAYLSKICCFRVLPWYAFEIFLSCESSVIMSGSIFIWESDQNLLLISVFFPVFPLCNCPSWIRFLSVYFYVFLHCSIQWTHLSFDPVHWFIYHTTHLLWAFSSIESTMTLWW